MKQNGFNWHVEQCHGEVKKLRQLYRKYATHSRRSGSSSGSKDRFISVLSVMSFVLNIRPIPPTGLILHILLSNRFPFPAPLLHLSGSLMSLSPVSPLRKFWSFPLTDGLHPHQIFATQPSGSFLGGPGCDAWLLRVLWSSSGHSSSSSFSPEWDSAPYISPHCHSNGRSGRGCTVSQLSNVVLGQFHFTVMSPALPQPFSAFPGSVFPFFHPKPSRLMSFQQLYIHMY